MEYEDYKRDVMLYLLNNAFMSGGKILLAPLLKEELMLADGFLLDFVLQHNVEKSLPCINASVELSRLFWQFFTKEEWNTLVKACRDAAAGDKEEAVQAIMDLKIMPYDSAPKRKYYRKGVKSSYGSFR